MKQWWNRLNQHETGWIRSMKQWWNMLNQDDSAMKQFFSWISNETNCFIVVKHRETWWIRMKHCHETPRIRMKLCFMVMKHTVSCQWNTLNQERWPQIYLFFYILIFGSWCFMVFHCAVSCCSVMFHAVSCCFTVFHCAVSCCFIAVSCCFIAVSLLFNCCFIAVSCCFIAISCCFIAVSCCFIAVSCCFIYVSRCFIALFHGVSRCFIVLFKPVSWPWNRCSGNESLLASWLTSTTLLSSRTHV